MNKLCWKYNDQVNLLSYAAKDQKLAYTDELITSRFLGN